MSGRKDALRTHILTDSVFLDGMRHEERSKLNLNADDDNFITILLASHGWKTYIQYNLECMLETTLEPAQNSWLTV